MAADSTEIANLALGRIGHEKISDITDDNKAARQCNLAYTNERDVLLTAFPWNFAKKNVFLENKTYATAGTLAFADADPDTITDSSSSFITTGGILAGMRITIDDSDSNDSTFTIASVAEALITLISTDALTAETTSGITITLRRSQGYDYIFDKPSNYLTTFPIHSKSSNLNLGQNYLVEGDYIYANDDEIQLEYIAQITDVTKFPSHFINALFLKIAAQVCIPVTKNRALQQDILREYDEVMKRAGYYDSKEGQADESPPNTSFGWIQGRK